MPIEFYDCTLCGEDEISAARYALGYRTCLACGEAQAKAETAAKQARVAQMPKSNAIYLGDGKAALEAFKTVSQGSRGGHSF